jgi:3-phenylpropionate/trans-cinnamate dioxygenase ferredoxin subunit
VTVARAAELAPGEWRVVDMDDAQIAVFNLDGEFHAISDVCTHDGGQLTGGKFEGDPIVSRVTAHASTIRTGAALSAPAYEPTETFPVRVENGEIEVRDNRWD